MTRRRLFLHVGASKSGTTALQVALRESERNLVEHGLAVLLSRRPAVERALLRPLGWEAGSGFVGTPVEKPLARLARKLEAVAEASVLISNEDLAELDAARTREIVELARGMGFDAHIVVTARDWARQLPSEWQQFLKHRMTDTFVDFLEDVRHDQGFYAGHFRLRQDVSGICGRWAADLPPENVHVLAMPRRGVDDDFLFRQMTSLLGVPREALRETGKDVNSSYGVVEAEVYRRLNVELGRVRPQNKRRTFGPLRQVLSEGVLQRGASQRILLPLEHLPWVRAEAERQVGALSAAGYDIHGDVAALLPDERDTGPTPEVDDAELARAAITTLARFAARTVLTPPPEAPLVAGVVPAPVAPWRRWLGIQKLSR